MHGNVREWCWDYYGSYQDNVKDPTGANEGSDRVARGGSCVTGYHYCKSNMRLNLKPQEVSTVLGFRVALRTSGIPEPTE